MILWYYYLTVFLPPLPPAMSQVDTTADQKRKYGKTTKQETCCYHHYYCSKLFNDFTLSVVSFSTLFFILQLCQGLLCRRMAVVTNLSLQQSLSKADAFVESLLLHTQRHAYIRNLQKNIKKRTTDLCIVISIKLI